MIRSPILLAASLALAAPAAAVTVTGVIDQGNDWSVAAAAPGLLEMDFGLRGQAPVIVGLAADAGEAGFEFNSVVDLFLGFNGPNNTQRLVLTLSGATFATVGSIAPSFAGHSVLLDRTGTRLVIRFDDPGEPNAVVLGNVLGEGENFRILFDLQEVGGPLMRNLPAAVSALEGPTLSIRAVVPEPATWAMFITGFGLAGLALRRRRAVAG